MVGSGGITSSLEVTELRLKAVLIRPLGMFYMDVLKLVLCCESVVCFLFEFVSIVVLWSVILFCNLRSFLACGTGWC